MARIDCSARQQQESPPQKVRKRTISLQSQRSDRRLLYWALASALSLTLFGGWWFYSKAAATLSNRLRWIGRRTLFYPEPTRYA